MPEVGVQQRLGDLGGQIRGVVGERFAVREPQPLQYDQRRVRHQPQMPGDRPVHGPLQPQHLAALVHALALQLAEEAVERAQWLLYATGVQPAGAAAFGDHQAVGAQLAQRLPDGVPADLVLAGEPVLGRELRAELAGFHPAAQIVEELGPQGQRRAPVQGARAVRAIRRLGRHGGFLRGRTGW